MRPFIVLVLIIAGIVGLGLWRGWFRVSSEGSGGTPAVTVTVDKDKFEQDKDDAVDKAQDLGQQAKDQAATPAKAK